MSDLWSIVRATAQGWQKHNDGRIAAALSFFAVFSVAPIVVLIVSAVGALSGTMHATHQLQNLLTALIGPRSSRTVSQLGAAFSRHGSGRSTLVLAGILILGYTVGFFIQVQNALDDIWEIDRSAKGGFWRVAIFRARALFGIAALAVLAMLAFAGADLLGTLLHASNASASTRHTLLQLGSSALNVAILMAFLTVVYRMVPQIEVGWRSAALGGFITTITLVIGEVGLSLYFTHTDPGAWYGAIASFVIVLIWIHSSAVLLVIGAELTRVLETGLHRPGALR